MSCAIDDCSNNAVARGLCNACYCKSWANGTLPPKLPKLSTEQRFWAKVVKTDDCWLWNAGIDSHGYGMFSFNGRSMGAHRFAYELSNGPIPVDMEVDHHHRCPKHCVNPAHLRLATHKQNQENRSGAQRNNSIGVRGVRRAGNRWLAEIRHNNASIHIGVYDHPEDAAEAARLKRLELFSHNDSDRIKERIKK